MSWLCVAWACPKKRHADEKCIPQNNPKWQIEMASMENDDDKPCFLFSF
jgi:type II secretory pathway component PulL